jgi:metal-responsive CopG/Arc/MetJ family transcriptional regulator
MRRKSRITISLSDEVVEEVKRMRGLVKRSTCYESLIRRMLNLEPEVSTRMITIRKRRQSPIMVIGYTMLRRAHGCC